MDNIQIARSFYEGINQRDIEAMLALVDDGFRMVDQPRGLTLQGKAGARTDLEGWMKAFPDAQVQVTQVVGAGDDVVVEMITRGTHRGVMGSGPQALQPTGKRVEVPFCDVLRFNNGKIVQLRSYYDLATMFRQLGISPPAPMSEAAPRKDKETRPQ